MSALTKILIVLQLVFSVAVSVLLVLMISHQVNYKERADTATANYLGQSALLTKSKADEATIRGEMAAAMAAKEKAEQDLATARNSANTTGSAAQNQILGLGGEKRALEAQVQALTAALKTASESLSVKDKELAELRPTVTEAITKNNDLARRNNEMESQIRAQELAIRKLQEQLTAGTTAGASNGSSGTIQMMSNAPSATNAVNAKVTDVRETAGRTLIEMPLGTRDGIAENTKVFIYRSSGYVADAVVQRVTPTAAVAVVTKTNEGQKVQAGDTVSTIGK